MFRQDLLLTFGVNNAIKRQFLPTGSGPKERDKTYAAIVKATIETAVHRPLANGNPQHRLFFACVGENNSQHPRAGHTPKVD
jgi:hypothetical protein